MEDLLEIEAIELPRGTSYAYLLTSGAKYFEHEEAGTQPSQCRRVVYRSRSED